ncbi:hypothetical protein [Bradyrhizobium glycinis]|nr:hypothetical protein [Bradyrhizobium glycinis]MBH5371474.1 hypothetical protein [Bradyrhizobium glycinis]
MAKRNRQKGKQVRAPFDPELAAQWAEILRLREQIKKAIARRKTKIRRLH